MKKVLKHAQNRALKRFGIGNRKILPLSIVAYEKGVVLRLNGKRKLIEYEGKTFVFDEFKRLVTVY